MPPTAPVGPYTIERSVKKGRENKKGKNEGEIEMRDKKSKSKRKMEATTTRDFGSVEFKIDACQLV